MKNMDKGLTVPKWVLINHPKISQIPDNSSAQVWDFDEIRLHWVSVVRGHQHAIVHLIQLKNHSLGGTIGSVGVSSGPNTKSLGS